MRDDRFSIDIPKRWLRRAVVAVAVGMLVLPAAAWAGHQFEDVPDSNTFHEAIDWMKDEGVTVGCNPPENTKYCPEENVTRQQMAAFLYRMDSKEVFVTPEELDAQSHHAVINGQDGAVIAEDGLEDVNHVGNGEYYLDFAAPVDDCSWTGSLGARNGDAITTSHTLTLNDDNTVDDAITVNIVDSDGTAANHDFNVTITCW